MKLLIIEDEMELSKSITKYLSDESYLCEQAYTYEQAIEKVNLYDYDCILLDLMLPGGNGLEILNDLKKNTGVIIISAKDSLDDKIKGLQIGADDYLSKPFFLPELAARIHSVIRRRNFENSNIITYKELEVNVISKTVKVNSTIIPLTKKEFDLLLFLMGNKNKVVTKTAIAEHLSGDLAEMLDSYDFIYAHIKNLKKKLADAGCGNYLKTLYGNGYKWEV
ncbi:response regulator transcription factor [Pseudopedobacter sp.]|uniref:response regulator transcription factor n=1 Tax=Pseudopedobacter sp. TaxID=1936787 RepID=UPI003341FA03